MSRVPNRLKTIDSLSSVLEGDEENINTSMHNNAETQTTNNESTLHEVIIDDGELPKNFSQFKNIPAISNKIREIKMINYGEKTIKRVSKLIDLIKNEDGLRYNQDVLRGIMQIIENDMSNKRKQGEYKKRAVLHLAACFFDDNTELLSSMIENNMGKIKQVRYARRLFFRLKKVCTDILDMMI